MASCCWPGKGSELSNGVSGDEQVFGAQLVLRVMKGLKGDLVRKKYGIE
jgi:hypothetical protein